MSRVTDKITSHDFVKLLSDKPYAFFLLSVIFSQVAFNMMNIVLIFIVFNLTSSNFLVSMILLISLLPQVMLSFIGGIVADTGNKKNILEYGNFGRALFVFPLIFLNSALAAVYFLALLTSIATQFYLPAETPIIPKIVPESLLVPANSLFGLALFGSILIGYVIAGPALLALGNSYVFALISSLFLMAAFFAYLIPKHSLLIKLDISRRKTVSTEVRDSFKQYLFDTYKLLGQTKDVAPSFILLVVSQVVVMVLAIIIPGYAKNILQIEVENVSLLLFAPAALGMIVSAYLVGTVLKNANRNKLMNTGVFLSAIILLLFPAMAKVTSREVVVVINAFLPQILKINVLHMVVVLSFLAGVGNAFIFIPAQTTIQEKIPENFRSKMYGLLFAFIGLFSLLPIILVGGLADVVGVNFVLILMGLLILIGGIFQMIFMRIVSKR
ncbi:MAG: MFS transporter [Candidatus Levyibacteriota bacterium]